MSPSFYPFPMKKIFSFLFLAMIALGFVAGSSPSWAEIANPLDGSDLSPCALIQKRIEEGKFQKFLDRIESVSTKRSTWVKAKLDAMTRLPEDVRTQMKDVVDAVKTMHVNNFNGLFDILAAADCPIDQTETAEVHDLFISNYETVTAEVSALVDILEADLDEDCPAAGAIMEDIRADLEQAQNTIEALFYNKMKENYANVDDMTNEELKELLVMYAENTTIYFQFLVDDLMTDVFHFETAMIACVN